MYALIIAGGEGERLRPYTWDRPKPMVEVAGRPILEHQVRWLKRYGVTHVVILCHYKAEVVQDYFGDGSRFGLHISYTVEERPLGRGGALKLGHTLLPADADPIVALNGDILTNQPLDRLVAYHQRKGAVATIMLVPLKSPYGIVAWDGRAASGSLWRSPASPSGSTVASTSSLLPSSLYCPTRVTMRPPPSHCWHKRASSTASAAAPIGGQWTP
mgnify:CR=1 FL=1